MTVGDGAVVGGGFPDAPGQKFVGAVADLVLAGLDLVPGLVGVGLAVVGPNPLGRSPGSGRSRRWLGSSSRGGT